MLSDACADFYNSVRFEDEGWVTNISHDDVNYFHKQVESYSKPDFDYPPEHINGLRNAIQSWLANPKDKRIGEHLIALAEAMRALYDEPPSPAALRVRHSRNHAAACADGQETGVQPYGQCERTRHGKLGAEQRCEAIA
jgi:hypothetical protein